MTPQRFMVVEMERRNLAPDGSGKWHIFVTVRPPGQGEEGLTIHEVIAKGRWELGIECMTISPVIGGTVYVEQSDHPSALGEVKMPRGFVLESADVRTPAAIGQGPELYATVRPAHRHEYGHTLPQLITQLLISYQYVPVTLVRRVTGAKLRRFEIANNTGICQRCGDRLRPHWPWLGGAGCAGPAGPALVREFETFIGPHDEEAIADHDRMWSQRLGMEVARSWTQLQNWNGAEVMMDPQSAGVVQQPDLKAEADAAAVLSMPPEEFQRLLHDTPDWKAAGEAVAEDF